MKYEVLNVLQRADTKWEFAGRIIDGVNTIAVVDTVPHYRTNGMIKRAIKDKMNIAMEKYQAIPAQEETKTVSSDSTFKDKFSAVMEL